MLKSAPRFVAALVMVGLAACACTSSGSATRASSSPSSPNPAGAGSTIAAGPGAGSAPVGSDTYTAPTTAPYPTPGKAPLTPATQAAVLASLPGSASSSCARVGSRTTVRAGAIGMGNFQLAQRQFASQQGHTEEAQLNLYVIPEHTKHLTAATVRVDPPGSRHASTVRAKDVEQADPYSYFALTLPVPTAGTYRLTVSVGPDHGCFIVSFAK